MRTLPPDRQTPPMPQSSVTADVHQPLDVHLDLLSQIAFDIALLIDNGSYPVDLFLGQLANATVRADMSLAQNLVSTRSPDPVYVRKAYLNPLIARQINACYSSHSPSTRSSLSLSLFVLGIGADYPHNTPAVNYFAVIANPFYRSSYFHSYPSPT